MKRFYLRWLKAGGAALIGSAWLLLRATGVRFGTAVLGAALIGSACVPLTACGGGAGEKAMEDQGPLGVIRDRAQSERQRTMAVEELRSQTSAGVRVEGGRISPREVYKEIAWTATEPAKLRAAVVDALLNDPDPIVVADAKEMAKALLPKEATRSVVVVICRNAGTKGWADFVPAIVRAYARTLPGVEEADRVERKALIDLNPTTPIEEVVFNVFLHPPSVPPTEGLDWTMRYRADAWNVLARIDPAGQARARMLDSAASVQGDIVLEAVRAGKRELGIVPITGEELTWLVSLRNPKKPENAAWWREAANAVTKIASGVRGDGALLLRHVEPVRWALAYRPQWLAMSREQLLGELTGQIAGREMYPRTATEGKSQGPAKSELLERRAAELSWGDMLSILVIDEALHQPQVVSAVFAQAQADREDATTEYGGLLAWKKVGIGAGGAGEARKPDAATGAASEHSVVMLYMPRSAQRISDTQFTASDDMVGSGDLALAHYHFHVQKEKNAQFAGPSRADLEYADRFGRSCIVLTAVKDGVMAVDYYQRGGVVVDMGGLVVNGNEQMSK